MNGGGRWRRDALLQALQRTRALAYKELLHIRRDGRVLLLGLLMPVLLLIIFGFGITFDLPPVPLAVLDEAGTSASRALVRRVVASDDFRLAYQVHAAHDLETLLVRGEAGAALVLAPNAAAPSGSASTAARVQLLIDGADANMAAQVLVKGEALLRAARVTSPPAAMAAPPGAARFVVQSLIRFNPEGRSAIYLVPGLMAYILALVAVLLTALTVAREWERGSMELLLATPVGRLEIVCGKLLPYLALGAVQVLLVLSVGAWVFAVPMRGSLCWVALAALLFLVGMLGQGLLISVVTRQQTVATQVGLLSSLLPCLLLSGFVFPLHNMPWPLQWLSTLVPARYFVTALRALLLKGTAASELLVEFGAMLSFAALMLLLATWRFPRCLR